MKRYLVPILGALAMLILVSFWYMEKKDEAMGPAPSPERQAECEQFLTVASFESGEAADAFMEACLRGEPVLPREGPDEGAIDEGPDMAGNVGPGCAIGGCSGQICGEASDEANMVSTCEYRPEYACYEQARCERQASGQCGWTETDEYLSCRSEVSMAE